MLSYQVEFIKDNNPNFGITLDFLNDAKIAQNEAKKSKKSDNIEEIIKHIIKNPHCSESVPYNLDMLGYRKYRFICNNVSYRLIYAILNCCTITQKETYNCRFYENCNDFPKPFAPETCAGKIRFIAAKTADFCHQIFYKQQENNAHFFAHYLKDRPAPN